MASSKGSGPGTMLFKPGDVPNPLFSAPIIALISIGVGYAIEHFQLESLLEGVMGPLPNQKALFMLSVFGLAVLNIFLGGSVARARAQYAVPLPFMYPCEGSKEAKGKDPVAFMTVVRGHENFLEFLPLFLAAIGIEALALNNWALAAASGFVWTMARVLYAMGYASNVNARLPGFFVSLLVYFGLFGHMAFVAIQMVRW